MAKKSTPAPADEITAAMDYAQHQTTWDGFVALLKWLIVALLIICIALYLFIEAAQPVLGTLLLLAIPVGAIGLAVVRWRNPA